MEEVADKEVRVDRLEVVRVRLEMEAMEATAAAQAQVEEILDRVGWAVTPVTTILATQILATPSQDRPDWKVRLPDHPVQLDRRLDRAQLELDRFQEVLVAQVTQRARCHAILQPRRLDYFVINSPKRYLVAVDALELFLVALRME
jgi:hypothetical protein